MEYEELYQRGITEQHIDNLMRATNITDRSLAEERIRELFPVIRPL
ncbi:hypothetical protein [Candidatus Methanoperedens nitratireducens]|uniref:Uncharacterized protein n=1 Tax=Candidatus Methanoperedens nitratireducens TaxID=1392998 RepID=A0A284VNN0_9EURY|nr:hypothetical protein [Candidatus Methanoperedens nitroreducens]SNQ60874.1 hypothetical protein MNV_2060016 [Candidatus Methanoperedens nitroreducens]